MQRQQPHSTPIETNGPESLRSKLLDALLFSAVAGPFMFMFVWALLAPPEFYCDPTLPCADGLDWRTMAVPAAPALAEVSP